MAGIAEDFVLRSVHSTVGTIHNHARSNAELVTDTVHHNPSIVRNRVLRDMVEADIPNGEPKEVITPIQLGADRLSFQTQILVVFGAVRKNQ
jgi:hypothetical protein